jgi:hypothetical protein
MDARSVKHFVEHNAESNAVDSNTYRKSGPVKLPFECLADRKGNMFPLNRIRSRVALMNRRLTEFQIRATCRELVARDANLSGRQLRKELRNRFGAVGKTARVFELWREETAKLQIVKVQASLPTEVVELQRRLQIAEALAAENLKRAELAEYRERAHQDHWALEVDRLKQQLQSQVQAEAGPRSIPFRV